MGALQVMFGLYATVLPFAVLGAWMAVALWDLVRRDDLGRGPAIGWSLAVLVVPVVGAGAYLLASSGLPRWQAGVFVGGGIAAYLVMLAITMALGGTA